MNIVKWATELFKPYKVFDFVSWEKKLQEQARKENMWRPVEHIVYLDFFIFVNKVQEMRI